MLLFLELFQAKLQPQGYTTLGSNLVGFEPKYDVFENKQNRQTKSVTYEEFCCIITSALLRVDDFTLSGIKNISCTALLRLVLRV